MIASIVRVATKANHEILAKWLTRAASFISACRRQVIPMPFFMPFTPTAARQWERRSFITPAAPELTRSGYAQVAQLVEHATENRSVGGSIPPLGTSKIKNLRELRHFELDSFCVS
jgi:hypothetical protein